MSFIHGDSIEPQEFFPRVQVKSLTNKELGAESLTVLEVSLPPGARVPLHTHPGHEESMIILDGEPQATLGEEVVTLKPGDAVLAPKGVKHRMVNASDRPVRLLGIFPTTAPQREMLEEVC